MRRLRAAGAVIIGKTNVPELCIWPFTETATFGATRNPWDLQRAPGGSSGGSAAAVAAGLVGAALGSDGAGSIRIPAAWCGLFGLKPQRGRVLAGAATARLARAVGQRRADALASPTRRCSTTSPRARPTSTSTARRRRRRPFAQAAATPPGRLRIAFSTRIPPGVIAKLDGDAERALRETVELLRSLGHEVTERDPDYGLGMVAALIPRYLRGVHDDARAMRAPRAPGTAHARDGASRRADPAGAAGSGRSPARPSSRAG